MLSVNRVGNNSLRNLWLRWILHSGTTGTTEKLLMVSKKGFNSVAYPHFPESQGIRQVRRKEMDSSAGFTVSELHIEEQSGLFSSSGLTTLVYLHFYFSFRVLYCYSCFGVYTSNLQ